MELDPLVAEEGALAIKEEPGCEGISFLARNARAFRLWRVRSSPARFPPEGVDAEVLGGLSSDSRWADSACVRERACVCMHVCVTARSAFGKAFFSS